MSLDNFDDAVESLKKDGRPYLVAMQREDSSGRGVYITVYGEMNRDEDQEEHSQFAAGIIGYLNSHYGPVQVPIPAEAAQAIAASAAHNAQQQFEADYPYADIPPIGVFAAGAVTGIIAAMFITMFVKLMLL